MKILKQGENKRVRQILSRKDQNGVSLPYDLLVGEDITVVLYIGDQEVKRYSFSEGTITKGQDPGEYVWVIEREDSKQFATGKLSAEYLVKFNDPDLPGGFFTVAVVDLLRVESARSVNV